MKILWKCSIIIPMVAEITKKKAPATGGWLDLVSRRIAQEHELIVVYPDIEHLQLDSGKLKIYSFIKDNDIEIFNKALAEQKPDIIHIWGTELPHSYYFIKCCEQQGYIDRTLVSIQGLTSVYAKHIYNDLPVSVRYGFSLRDLLKLDNVYFVKKRFERWGKFEIETIKLAKHILGRTDFDEAATEQINPMIHYHLCYETLRESFYKHRWSKETCDKQSIFVSNSTGIHKGFHNAIIALSILREKYPDIKIYTCGPDIINMPFYKITTYSRYIRRLITSYKLENNVVFLGNLSEQEMVNYYLKSNAFVCCSAIENSPNSLGEALTLGVPTVSSDVGGVSTFISHGVNGFMYNYNAPYMLAYYIDRIFSDDKIADLFQDNNQIVYRKFFDPEFNYTQLIRLYQLNGIDE